MNNTPTTQDPAHVAHDEQLLVILGELSASRQRLSGAYITVLQYLGYSARRPHPHGPLGAFAALQTLIDNGDEMNRSWRKRPSEILAEHNTARHAVTDIADRLAEHEGRYTLWARYFLVTSSDGHIHRTMGCSTCNKGRSVTTFALLPGLSDTSTDTAVTALGAALCSVCFPDAPVDQREQTKIPARIVAALFTEGETAFRAALTEYRTKSAARAAARCPGSGTARFVAGSVRNRYPSNIATCAVCSTVQSMTSAGNLRPHTGR